MQGLTWRQGEMQSARFGALEGGRRSEVSGWRRARSSTSPTQCLVRGALMVRNKWTDARVREALIKSKNVFAKEFGHLRFYFGKILTALAGLGGVWC